MSLPYLEGDSTSADRSWKGTNKFPRGCGHWKGTIVLGAHTKVVKVSSHCPRQEVPEEPLDVLTEEWDLNPRQWRNFAAPLSPLLSFLLLGRHRSHLGKGKRNINHTPPHTPFLGSPTNPMLERKFFFVLRLMCIYVIRPSNVWVQTLAT